MATAILNGFLTNDGGAPCDVRFQYGLTPALGTFTPWMGDGGVSIYTTGMAFSYTLNTLLPNTIYFFQAEAQNVGAVAAPGAVLSFTTGGGGAGGGGGGVLAEVIIMPATLIREVTARLNGMIIEAFGGTGSVRFQWGATTAYGQNTPWQGGFAAGVQFWADIAGLAPGSAYHYRAQLQIGSTIANSGDGTFTTRSSGHLPVMIETNLVKMLLDKK